MMHDADELAQSEYLAVPDQELRAEGEGRSVEQFELVRGETVAAVV